MKESDHGALLQVLEDLVSHFEGLEDGRHTYQTWHGDYAYSRCDDTCDGGRALRAARQMRDLVRDDASLAEGYTEATLH